MSYKYFLVENVQGLRKLIINNPKKRNAFNQQAYAEWCDAINVAASDPTVKVLAITGFGDFYSSGNDLSFPQDSDKDVATIAKEGTLKILNLTRAFINFPKLLVAVVNGPCIGIAATTAALCDVVYATDNAYFLTPFTNLGLCAEACSSYTFPKIMGKSKASEMLLLNHRMDAAEALKYHFVAKVVKQAELQTVIWPELLRFSKMPIGALMASKKLIAACEVEDLNKALTRELIEMEKRYSSEELLEALMAFMTKKGSKL